MELPHSNYSNSVCLDQGRQIARSTTPAWGQGRAGVDGCGPCLGGRAVPVVMVVVPALGAGTLLLARTICFRSSRKRSAAQTGGRSKLRITKQVCLSDPRAPVPRGSAARPPRICRLTAAGGEFPTAVDRLAIAGPLAAESVEKSSPEASVSNWGLSYASPREAFFQGDVVAGR